MEALQVLGALTAAFNKQDANDKRVVLDADRIVHVVVEFERCRTDGTAVGKHAALWTLSRIDGRWGIQVRSAT